MTIPDTDSAETPGTSVSCWPMEEPFFRGPWRGCVAGVHLFSSCRTGTSSFHGEILPAFLSLSFKRLSVWRGNLDLNSEIWKLFIHICSSEQEEWLSCPFTPVAEQFFSTVPWGVHECMNEERKVVLARKPAAHSHSEGVCFPANVPIEMGHVRFTQWTWKGAYLRSRAHCLARSLIKLLPPTTHLWGSHACKNLFQLTCHIDDSSSHHPTFR